MIGKKFSHSSEDPGVYFEKNIAGARGRIIQKAVFTKSKKRVSPDRDSVIVQTTLSSEISDALLNSDLLSNSSPAKIHESLPEEDSFSTHIEWFSELSKEKYLTLKKFQQIDRLLSLSNEENKTHQESPETLEKDYDLDITGVSPIINHLPTLKRPGSKRVKHSNRPKMTVKIEKLEPKVNEIQLSPTHSNQPVYKMLQLISPDSKPCLESSLRKEETHAGYVVLPSTFVAPTAVKYMPNTEKNNKITPERPKMIPTALSYKLSPRANVKSKHQLYISSPENPLKPRPNSTQSPLQATRALKLKEEVEEENKTENNVEGAAGSLVQGSSVSIPSPGKEQQQMKMFDSIDLEEDEEDATAQDTLQPEVADNEEFHGMLGGDSVAFDESLTEDNKIEDYNSIYEDNEDDEVEDIENPAIEEIEEKAKKQRKNTRKFSVSKPLKRVSKKARKPSTSIRRKSTTNKLKEKHKVKVNNIEVKENDDSEEDINGIKDIVSSEPAKKPEISPTSPSENVNKGMSKKDELHGVTEDKSPVDWRVDLAKIENSIFTSKASLGDEGSAIQQAMISHYSKMIQSTDSDNDKAIYLALNISNGLPSNSHHLTGGDSFDELNNTPQNKIKTQNSDFFSLHSNAGSIDNYDEDRVKEIITPSDQNSAVKNAHKKGFIGEIKEGYKKAPTRRFHQTKVVELVLKEGDTPELNITSKSNKKNLRSPSMKARSVKTENSNNLGFNVDLSAKSEDFNAFDVNGTGFNEESKTMIVHPVIGFFRSENLTPPERHDYRRNKNILS